MSALPPEVGTSDNRAYRKQTTRRADHLARCICAHHDCALKPEYRSNVGLEVMAEIKILSTHAVQEVLSEIGPLFERASGLDLAIDYDPTNALKRTIEAGTPFDVAIVTRAVIDELAVKGKVRRETCKDICRSGLGIVVRRGAAVPD